jgi:hypothetical protein
LGEDGTSTVWQSVSQPPVTASGLPSVGSSCSSEVCHAEPVRSPFTNGPEPSEGAQSELREASQHLLLSRVVAMGRKPSLTSSSQPLRESASALIAALRSRLHAAKRSVPINRARPVDFCIVNPRIRRMHSERVYAPTLREPLLPRASDLHQGCRRLFENGRRRQSRRFRAFSDERDSAMSLDPGHQAARANPRLAVPSSAQQTGSNRRTEVLRQPAHATIRRHSRVSGNPRPKPTLIPTRIRRHSRASGNPPLLMLSRA